MPRAPLLLEGPERQALWRALHAALEASDDVASWAVAPTVDAEALRAAIAGVDFHAPVGARTAFAAAFEAMRSLHVQPAHPRYFGLFTPAPATMAVAADALVSALNPQLATRAHSPFAVEVEASLVRAFATRFGFAGDAEGVFTSGGAEATQTALTAALVARFPEVHRRGLRSLTRTPTLYASVEAHASLVKAARIAGLGDEALRRVSVDKAWRMKPAALAEVIANDRQAGFEPFLVVATAGTTTTGAIDPLGAIADVAQRTGCWLHVDAAWGGLAAFAPSLLPALASCERADSIAFDPHKALCAPVGTGVYLSRRHGALRSAFDISAGYMPRDAGRDPYAHSVLWSRRFVGLRVWLTLAVAGWQGLAETIERQSALGTLLRERLVAEGWELANDSLLPLVCFVDPRRPDGRSARFLAAVARRVRETHNAWISLVRLASGARALRACVTSMRTSESDIEALVEGLLLARSAIAVDAP